MSANDHSPTEAFGAAIAIVGIAGRFPGAPDARAFWKNLREGRECITHFAPGELEDVFSDETRAREDFVAARPILDDVDLFDAEFFGMHAREAALTDPQQRVLLESCWQALEDAGHDPAGFNGAIGVFAGATVNTYFLKHVLRDRAAIEDYTSNLQVGSYQEFMGAMQDLIATRVAYKLDLKGPAVNIQTACSTSLTAVAQACQSLLLYQSDMALAGGVSITFPQRRGYLALEGGMVSTDGHCRPFDAKASGTIFGHGVGVVVLKRLDDAIADRDHIYAVIRGFGLNNDGASKIGLTAPSVEGQSAVIASALAMAGVDAGDIGYVEAHGTATPLGDPIEFRGLEKAFRATTAKRGTCVLGSAKANVGHLDAAAGVTGLIKAALVLDREEIPPLVNFTTPNPNIDLAQSPFKVVTELTPWPAGKEPRLAGVSSFGVGGTNVHVVLEEAPRPARRAPATARAHILPLSARNADSLARMTQALADRLEQDPSLELRDVAHTLQTGRRAFDVRMTAVAADREQAIRALRGGDAARARPKAVAPKVVMMFPGQGAQYPGMGKALYDAEPEYRRHVDRGASVLEPLIGADLRTLMFADVPAGDDAPHPIRSTVMAQPALFVTEYALAKLLMSRGVEPAAMIGHSVGEFVAACLAGVLSFEDALKLVAARGRLMQDQPAGAMLSVRTGEARLRELLTEGVDIAAINAPALTVAAGPFHAIEKLEARLDAEGVAHRRLHTSHAFHSAMMDPVVEGLKAIAAGANFTSPKLRYVSSVTGAWVGPEDSASPDYWARHCRQTVRFADALATVLAEPDLLLVEVGPGRTLSTFAGQAKTKGNIRAALPTLPEFANSGEDCLTFAAALGGLWREGVALDWTKNADPGGRRVSLPAYAFARKRHWIEAPAVVRDGKAAIVESESEPIVQAAEPAFVREPTPQPPAELSMTDRTTQLQARIRSLLEELSGESLDGASNEASFLELGFDSLFLGQIAQRLQKTFGVKITFRQLMREYPSIDALTAHLLANAKPESLPAAPVAMPVRSAAGIAPAPQPIAVPGVPAGVGIEAVLQNQLIAMQQLFAQQLQTLQSISGGVTPTQSPQTPALRSTSAPAAKTSEAEEAAPPSRFQMYRPGQKATIDEITPQKRAFIDDLIARLNRKTPNSKTRTQTYRDVLADPRTAAGFRAEWKEMVHPIVVERSKGSKLWDIDGCEYIDIVNGFGQTMFGHAPDFVVDAVAKQLKEGFAIGPQTPLAGEVARMFAEMTGNERVTFCNTGSEAVMAAMRIARAVTSREKIVVFAGAYHGQFDEVLAKAAASKANPGAQPIAPGITQEAVSNLVVLPYGSDDSLAWVRAHADELAAVVVETVQSRHPDLRPHDFLSELRAITEASETALVFDEVVTGFRAHPGGMQAVFNIRADLATYGKVVGGGMPVGVLAGKAKFMDALDGGFWRYGDDSVPEAAPTFFAGTFVRHPLVLAACKASLIHMKEKGPALQQGLSDKMGRLTADMNAHLAARGVKTRLETFASWCYANFAAEDPLASLLYHHMRLLGVHVIEGFPWFITTEHSDADLAKIADAFKQSIDALQSAGILAPSSGASLASAGDGSSDKAIEIPLTEEQREIWLAAELSDEASCAYNEGATVSLEGELKADVLAAALNDVIARHEALRATISRQGDRLHIAPSLTVEVPLVDLTLAADADARFAEILDEEATTPFDLANGPLLRARLCRRGPCSHALVITTHHIVCDGWSYGVVLDELAAVYGARLQGKKPDLGPVLPFRRYAAERGRAKPEDTVVEKYWLAEYQNLPPPMELPTDRPRPRVKTFRGATHSENLDPQLIAAVKKAGARSGATLFATLFAATQVLFSKLSGQDDIALTVPMAGQTLVEDEVLVGHCVNFLPVRAPLDVSSPFAKHLETVKAKIFQAIDHQSYTYGTLVQRLDLKRDPNRTPITDVQFNLEKFGRGVEFLGLTTSVITNPKAFVVFDLFLNMTEGDKGVRVDIDYSTDLYDAATIARWVGHLRSLLRSIADDPARPVCELAVLSGEERRWLIGDLNATQADYPKDKLIHELIEQQTARTPGAVALRYQDHVVTYRELDDMATRMANRLSALAPSGGQRIAVALPRSVDLVVALLAVLKSGNAYVPLDPTHPPARLAQTLEAADVGLLVCAEDRIAGLAPPRAQVVRLDRPAPVAARAAAIARPREGSTAPAYVIFTSGSTGAPKGVEIEHRAVVNFLYSMAKAPGFTAKDTIIALTTISFDIAGLELYLPLVTGGSAVIANRDDVKDGFALADMINRSQATVVQATPSLWRILLEAGLEFRPQLKMLCGGEPLPRDLANLLAGGGGELWNVYGPTETTIWSSAGRVEPGAEVVTIGAPIANTEIHILDGHGKLVPLGALGEVYIGGDGLARGYFNRPDLTAAAFRSIDVGDGKVRRLYRTGDVGRRLATGAIQLQGRKDHQIKLRGYRIELEDIEANIRSLAGVSEAAVMVHGTAEADVRLVAFYVAAGGRDMDHGRLQRELSEKVPEYMVPSAWQRLDRMPQTANGKLDRKALPLLLSAQRSSARAPATVARSPLERTLAEIWMDVLKVGEVGPEDRIFALGANSLHLFRIAAQIADRGIPLRTRHLMQNPTIGELAAMAEETAAGPSTADAGVPSLRDFRHGSRRKAPQ